MSTNLSLPSTIRTEHLILRCWKPSDAPLLKEALDANLAHLRPWMPWAVNEPSSLDVITARIDKFAADFEAGLDYVYGIFNLDQDAVLGGAGAHRRIGDDGFEIGYWIDVAHTRRGYATEAAAAITRLAFAQPATRRIQIRCDPDNVASAGVPRRLGYRHIETLSGDGTTPAGAPRDTMVWEMTRPEFESREVLRAP
jgi:RimJ/RimL family protein N-acetyltransferase